MDKMTALLEAAGLKKSFGKVRAVKDVNLKVNAGEVVGLLGRNGAGKTTTFRMIVGHLRPNAGKILYKNQDITSLPMFRRARLGIGYLPQEPSVFRDMTAETNLRVACEAIGIDAGQAKEKVEQTLEEFRLVHVSHSLAGVLSGGERRRLEVARILLTGPELLLFDEPFAGIDPITVNDLQDVIFALRKKSITVLLTDHNVRETLAITDRAYIMEEGEIWLEGTPEELAGSDEARRLYLGRNFRLDEDIRRKVKEAADERSSQT